MRAWHGEQLERMAQEDRVGPYAPMAAMVDPQGWGVAITHPHPVLGEVVAQLPLERDFPVSEVFRALQAATQHLSVFNLYVVRPQGAHFLIGYRAPAPSNPRPMRWNLPDRLRGPNPPVPAPPTPADPVQAPPTPADPVQARIDEYTSVRAKIDEYTGRIQQVIDADAAPEAKQMMLERLLSRIGELTEILAATGSPDDDLLARLSLSDVD